MDRDALIELFAAFGPVDPRRMFGGFGIYAEGIAFAIAAKEGVFLRADPDSEARFAAEGCVPFTYQNKLRQVTVRTYWQMPERLYDDPEALAEWARIAFASAQKAALAKPKKPARAKAGAGASGRVAAKAKASAKAPAKTKTKRPTGRAVEKAGKPARQRTAKTRR